VEAKVRATSPVRWTADCRGRLQSALNAGVITAQEAEVWTRFNRVRRACIMVDDFPHDLALFAAEPATVSPLPDAMLARKTA
jgi:hypothetical protein